MHRRSGLYIGQYYGGGSGPIWLNDLQCTGHENSLVECGHSGWDSNNCRHTYDLSIVCGQSEYKQS